MARLHRTGILLGSWAAFVLGCPGAVGQAAFDGTPPPSDARTDFDPEEAEASQEPGVFARKPFRMTLAVREGFDSNVFQTSDDPVESFYTNWAAGLHYRTGTPRLQVQTSLGAGLTYYYTRPGEKLDFTGLCDLRVIYLVTPRLTLALDSSTAFLSQPDQTIVGASSQENGDYLYSTTTVLAGYRWTERVSTVTSYNFSTILYTRSEINDQLGYVSQTLAQSLRWLWKPMTTLVAEYRFNPISYFSADLDSLANYFLLGFDHLFNPRFTWSVRGGFQVNFNDDPVGGSSTYFGPYGQSSLDYQFGPASALSWTLRYGTEPSGLAEVSQRQTFRTGLALVQAITARISANLTVDYQWNYYDQAGVIAAFFENVFSIGAGLKFTITRLISLEGGYQFSADFAPDEASRDYRRNVVFVGISSSF
jgi:Putative beta-barrel porin 2